MALIKQPFNTIILDIDGILADQVPHVLSRAEKDFGTKMKKSDITEWDTKVGNIPFDKLIAKYLEDPDWVRNMPVMDGAEKIVSRLCQVYNTIVATSRPNESEMATKDWLQKHFNIPATQFINTKSKADINGDVLIDDYIPNLNAFALRNSKRICILLEQPWNHNRILIQNLIAESRVIICKSWREIGITLLNEF